MREYQFDELCGLRHISVPWAKRCRLRCSTNSSMLLRLLKIWNCALDSSWNFDAYTSPESPKNSQCNINPEMFPRSRQEPTTGPYPDSSGSSQIPLIRKLKIPFNFLFSHFHPSTSISIWHTLLLSSFSTKALDVFIVPTMRATCSAPPIFINFVTQVIIGEEYKARRSLLCRFIPLFCCFLPHGSKERPNVNPVRN